jgi:hypothetical protein
MNAANESVRGLRRVLDYTPFPDVARGQWLSPQRAGVYRLVPPWVYRHPRFFAFAHVAGATVQVVAGLICAAYGAHGWAAVFLGIAALNFAGGIWYLSISSSNPTGSGTASAKAASSASVGA